MAVTIKTMIDETWKEMLDESMQEYEKSLEGQIQKLATRIDRLFTKCDTVSKDLTELNGSVSTALTEISTLKQEQKRLETKIDAVEDSQQFISKEFENQKHKITEMEGIIKELQTRSSTSNNRFIALKESLDTVKKSIVSNTTEIEELDIYMRRSNLEFHGIPFRNHENTDDIVKHIGSLLGVVIHGSDLSICHRLPSKKSDRPPPIIARFSTRKVRNSLYAKRKDISKISDLQIPGMKYLFINENLTAQRRELLNQTKTLLRKKNFKFIWTNNGNIYARKGIDSQRIHVKSVADLNLIQ